MLSEIGGEQAVDPIATLFSDNDLREDARCALERQPGEKSLAALEKSLTTVSHDFRSNVAQSLRARGITVPGVPKRNTVPGKQTGVKPL